MARFNDAYLTDAGADLIAQSITDGVKIDFVRMEIGDGEYTEEEKSKDVLRKRTSLKNKRQESSFNSVEKAKDSAVKLKAAIDNRNVTNGYRMTEIGIFAKASGDTASDGVLYSIAVAIEADYMPPESTPITYIQEFYTKVGNAENVEITVSTGVYALAEDLAELEEPTYTESEELEELTPGENLKLALGKLAKAVKEIITHMALKATGSVAGHVKVSSSAAVTDSTGMALAATEKNASLEGTLAYKLEQLNTNLASKLNSTWTKGTAVSTNSNSFAGFIEDPVIQKSSEVKFVVSYTGMGWGYHFIFPVWADEVVFQMQSSASPTESYCIAKYNRFDQSKNGEFVITNWYDFGKNMLASADNLKGVKIEIYFR